MDEFSLIDSIATKLGARRGAMAGIGDDATILEIPDGEQLVVSTDTLVEGVHFAVGTAPEDIAYKALAVNLSDLAAMGARPAWFLLALTLPSLDSQWTQAFATGLKKAAESAQIAIVGGDTTRGPLSITLTVCGFVKPGEALLRSGAQPGDVIGVSGFTGLAALALRDLERGSTPGQACLEALEHPVPRLELGQALVGLANSCIDVSDGLLADLNHIARASGVGMKIFLGKLPCPQEMSALDDEDRWNLQLSGGDDYELCFTVSERNWDTINARAQSIGLDVTRIGEVIAGQGSECFNPEGQVFQPLRSGYNHGVQCKP